MDLSRLSLSGWPSSLAARAAGAVSLAALVSAVATLALIAASRRGCPRARRAAAAETARRGGLRLPDQRREPEAADRAGAGAARRPAAGRRRGSRRSRRTSPPTARACRPTSRRWCSTAPASATTARAATAPPSRSSASRAAAPPTCRSARRARRRARCATPRRRSTAPAPSCASCATCSTARRCSPGATAPDGQVAWANAAYRDRFDAPAGELPDHRIADAFGHVLEEVPLTARGAGSRRRVVGARPRGRRAALVRGQPEPRARPARASASRSTPTTSSPPRRRSGASSRR